MSVLKFLRKNLGTVALLCTLTASLGFNVYQALTLRGFFVRPTGVRVGTKLPTPLPVADQDGRQVSLNFAEDARPTVLYVLSPLCGWCKRNEDNVKALAADAGSRFRFIGLSVEAKDLKDYIAQGHAPFPVYVVRSQDQIRQLHLDGTPETIVVNSTGRVERSWEGAYQSNNQQEIEKFFQVKLPGLKEVAVASQ